MAGEAATLTAFFIHTQSHHKSMYWLMFSENSLKVSILFGILSGRDDKDMLTVHQVAKMLGVNQNSVYLAASEGPLPYSEMLGRKVITRADTEAYQARIHAKGNKPKGRPKGSANRKKETGGETNG